MRHHRRGLYHPRHILWIGIFLTLVPAAVLCGVNYGRLRRPAQALRWYGYAVA